MTHTEIPVYVSRKLSGTIAVAGYGAERQKFSCIERKSCTVVKITEADTGQISCLEPHIRAHIIRYRAYLRSEKRTLHSKPVLVTCLLR